MKPYEVELLVAEVSAEPGGENEMYHIFYDGVVIDEQRFSVMGGHADTISGQLEEQFRDKMSLADAVKLGAKVLGEDDEPLGADRLEVALLDRSRRARRCFRRVKSAELDARLAIERAG